MSDAFNQLWWRLSPSEQRHLEFRASLYDMDAEEFYYSDFYSPPDGLTETSSATAMTREQWQVWANREEKKLKEKKAAWKVKQKVLHEQNVRRMNQRRHDKMLSEICAYALSHGWRPSRLKDLLEPGEELPWMYRREQIDPVEQ